MKYQFKIISKIQRDKVIYDSASVTPTYMAWNSAYECHCVGDKYIAGHSTDPSYSEVVVYEVQELHGEWHKVGFIK